MLVQPASFALPAGHYDINKYAAELKDFLSSELVQFLLTSHPNEIAKSGPSAACDWWDWACSLPADDALLFASNSQISGLPISIYSLLRNAVRLALPRSSIDGLPLPRPLPKGQTPKKVHEVQHFSLLISQLMKDLNVEQVVDVGAGQGYLSLELASKYNANVLALDFSEVQTSGSIHWAQQAKDQQLKLSHVTHHISSETLPQLVQDWLSREEPPVGDGAVIVIGLHACGSLTVEVLRACIDNIKARSAGVDVDWNVKACAIVGCCYNMLADSDKRLSSLDAPPLPADAFQLAAQPWLSPSPDELSLSLRKITYRALLGRLLHERNIPVPPDARVRRLKDAAYSTWDAYVQAALGRLGVDPHVLDDNTNWTEEMQRLASGLSVLHILRAKLGPVIESWILLDRYVWLHEQLEVPGLASVEMRWIFDSGISARSAAFIVRSLHE